MNQLTNTHMNRIIALSIFAVFALQAYSQNTFPTSGNVGIGTTGPSSGLHISSTGGTVDYTKSLIYIDRNRNDGWGGGLHFRAFNYNGTSIKNNVTIGNLLWLGENTEGNAIVGAGIRAISTSVWGASNAGSKLSFYTTENNTTSNLERLTIYHNGNVGIGNNAPTYKLDVNGTINATEILINGSPISAGGGSSLWDSNAAGLYTSNAVGIGAAPNGAKLGITLNESGEGLKLLGENLDVDFHLGHQGTSHGFYWRYKGTDSANNNDLELWAQNQNGTDQQVYNIHQDGNIQFLQHVSIGCEAQPAFKLAVNGTIGAREVVVEADSWADYVFADDYQLRPLSEVESYINDNKHLPDIPSETEVMENGISVGEMNAKLLQKIEELTLYIIEQEKRIQSLENKVKSE